MKTGKVRADFSAAVRRRDEARGAEAEANEEIGRLLAAAIDSGTGLVSALAEEAGISRPTAYAMAKRATGESDKMRRA